MIADPSTTQVDNAALAGSLACETLVEQQGPGGLQAARVQRRSGGVTHGRATEAVLAADPSTEQAGQRRGR